MGDMTETAHESAAARVAKVLLAFGLEPDVAELTVSDIARHVGRERSQISRMLKTLAATGLLEQDAETRAYRLGWQTYRLAARAGDHRLLTASRPALRMLVARTRETALLSVLSGNRSLTVARESSPQDLQHAGWVGRTSPLHITASGRALLMAMDDDEVRGLVQDDLDIPHTGPKAPKTADAVLELLTTERALGYTVAIDQLEDGLTSLGAPITGLDSTIVGCLNVSGPTSRLARRVPDFARPLLEATQQVTARLRGEKTRAKKDLAQP
jgi:DNA-binding IclR family transcriptional regulator